MKIAILTYWQSDDNYGQLLQCFALQHYLRKEGHDAYLVRYAPLNNNVIIQNKWILRLKNIKKYINPYYIFLERKIIIQQNIQEFQLSRNNAVVNKNRRFDEFRSKYLQQSELLYTNIEKLRSNPPDADIYICGSDQVWHDSIAFPNVAGWYLQFGNERTTRISYAASIGRNINTKEVNTFKMYLNSYNAISLREKSACDYCKSIGFNNSKTVCDPSFLLSANYYRDTFSIKEVASDPYVFFYTLNIRTKEEIFAEEILKEIDKLGWKIKTVSSSGYYTARNIIKEGDNFYSTIPEWLELISNSKLVITTSFHGTVFSILMHKPFISIPLKGHFAKANDRITNLLDILGLSYRIANNSEEITKIISSDIDWDDVDVRIKQYALTGKTFLKDVISSLT